ncbi:MAG: DUF4058 family protein [Gemmataceae bacterium]
MPLLDHFRPPLRNQRHWEGFHGRWAAALADNLNDELLPADYFAEFQLQVGPRVEIDVATFEERDNGASPGSGGATTMTWAPPKPTLLLPATYPDQFEVQVFSTRGGPTLVAAIELVSPGNKDRPGARRAFAAKCLSYLASGIGLIVIDIVTERRANLHDDLVDLSCWGDDHRLPGSPPLYAVAYRPVLRGEAEQTEAWHEALEIGAPLPALPLAVRGLGCLPIDFEATYMEARRRVRLS